MGCYWGCGTKGNRVAWTILANLFMIGTGLIIAGVVGNFTGKGSKNCLKVFTDCSDGTNDNMLTDDFWDLRNVTISHSKKECFKLADQQCNLKIWGALFLSGAGLLVLCMCITLFFCCCASKPSHRVNLAADANAHKRGAVTHAPAPQGAMYYPTNAVPLSAPAQQEAYGPGRV